MELSDFFRENPRAALAFSGGTDSAYLLYEALQCGAEVRPYYVKTPFQPRFELDDALRLTKELGTELTVIEYDILNDGLVAANPADRCYHCKKKLFGLLLRERAANDGFSLIIDGTNASDDAGDRPGMRALEGGGAIHLEQTGLRLPRDARPHGTAHRKRAASARGGGGERTVRPRLHRLPRAPLSRGSAYPASRRSDGGGAGKARGYSREAEKVF